MRFRKIPLLRLEIQQDARCHLEHIMRKKQGGAKKIMRHAEDHRTHRIGWLRAAVLGANDGIVSTASLIVGVAAAEANRGNVLVAGIAGLVFGFPGPGDPYLGLMILTPTARSQGHGPALLAHVEDIARATGATTLYLAVLHANPRGRAFWTRMGFAPTGVIRHDNSHGMDHTVYRLAKPL